MKYKECAIRKTVQEGSYLKCPSVLGFQLTCVLSVPVAPVACTSRKSPYSPAGNGVRRAGISTGAWLADTWGSKVNGRRTGHTSSRTCGLRSGGFLNKNVEN